MLDDEIGMNSTEVKKYGDVLDAKLSNEQKLYNYFVLLNSKAKNGYKSKNSNRLEIINSNIETQIKIKITNLNSYKKYIDKMRIAYINTSEKAIEISNDGLRQID